MGGRAGTNLATFSYDTPPPGGESLKDTGERVMPYFNQEILPLIKKGQNILISAMAIP